MKQNRAILTLLTLVLLFRYSLTESTTLAHNQQTKQIKEKKFRSLQRTRRGNWGRRKSRCDPFYQYLYGICGHWPFTTYPSPNNPFDQTPRIFPPPFRYSPRPPLVPSPLIIPPPMPVVINSPPPSPWWLSSPPPPPPWWYSSSPPPPPPWWYSTSPPPPPPDPIPWYITAPPPPPPDPIPWYIPAPPPPLVPKP
ncbi:hypothetical protein QL285_084558 [Trifolium repens]|nr:hypothetical protein QL285_084558 [Trifolium repens]